MRALVVKGSGVERYREGGSDGGSGTGRDTHRVTSAIAFSFARAGGDQAALQQVRLRLLRLVVHCCGSWPTRRVMTTRCGTWAGCGGVRFV